MKKDRLGYNAAKELAKKKRTEEITRIVALVVAFIGVFYFFIKLLFL